MLPQVTAGSVRAGLPAYAAPVATGAAALAACALVAVVDPNEPGNYPTCPFKALTGLDCPGCGSMRAVRALTRGQVGLAADLNILLLVALPVVVWAWAGWLARSVGRRWPAPLSVPGPVGWGVAVTVVAFWFVRNLPVAPFSYLGT